MVKEPYENKHPGTEGDQSHLGIIRNRKLALVWLKKNGWRASKSSLYRHIKEGRLPMAKSGTIDADDLRIYASAYLQPTTPPPDCKAVAGLLEIEKQAQIKLLQTREEKLRFETDLARDQYIKRDDAILEFSIKIGLFEAMTKTAARSNAEAWALLINGDVDRAGELYAAVAATIDEALDAMGQMDEIKVTIKKQPKVKND